MKYNIGWGLTNTCNMNCKFCYSKDTRRRIAEKRLADWIRFVDENHEYIDSINYGTGENALVDDFFTFIAYVRNKYPNIKQALTSNGYIYEKVSKDERLYNIYKECIDEIDISLDFADKDKHNSFRGQRNAYDWAMNALSMISEDGKVGTIVFVGFNETLEKENLDGLFQIARKFGVNLRMNVYRPVSESSEINEKFIVDYRVLRDAIEYINQEYTIVSLNDILFGNLYSTTANIKENTGIDSIRILPDGSICPSTYLIGEKYKSVYAIDQENVLENIQFPVFTEAPIPDACSQCIIKDKCCGGVYDRRMLWYGSLEHRDPYCPEENNDEVICENYQYSKKRRVSVHDGYLPTMFFSGERRDAE